MKKFFDSKVTKIIVLLTLIYLLYIGVMIITDKRDLNNLILWEELLIIISFILYGMGNLFSSNRKKLLGNISLIVAGFLIAYWYL